MSERIAVITDVTGSRATLRFDTMITPVMIGAGGIRLDKNEDDKATPIGLLPIRQILYRADRIATPTTTLPRKAITPEDGWCDDIYHSQYNRQVRLPFNGRHEQLWRADGSYDLLAVLGWNDDPIIAGRGSAIFLHLPTPDSRPTEGCIAIASETLQTILLNGLTAIMVPPQ